MVKVTESSAVRPPNFTVTSSQFDQRLADLGARSPVVGATISATTSGSASSGMHVGDVDRHRLVEDHRADGALAVGLLRHVPVFLADLGAGADCRRDRARIPNRGSLGHLRLLCLATPAGGDVQLAAVGQQLLPDRDQSLRPEDHQHHQRQAEEQVLVLGDLVCR